MTGWRRAETAKWRGGLLALSLLTIISPAVAQEPPALAGAAAAADEAVPQLPGRDFSRDLALPFDTRAPRVDLPKAPRLYSYSLRNDTAADIPGPVPYGKLLWYSARDLLRTSGAAAIRDEVERAKAVYSLVARHTAHGGQTMGVRVFRDPLKFLVEYGEGPCHAAATAQAELMELAGLRSRVWWLSGHVVPETYAGGAWRLFDPDQKVYFAAAGRGRIYGVEDLLADPRRFDGPVYFSGAAGRYPESSREIYLSTGDNGHFDAEKNGGGTRFDYALRPGEKIVFTNFNWGRYFEPLAFPGTPRRYYNGYFEYAADPARLRAGPGAAVSAAGAGFEIRNSSAGAPAALELDFASPFPVVGGAVRAFVEEKEGDLSFELAVSTAAGRLSFAAAAGGNNFEWDKGLAEPGPFPAFAYTLRIKLSPGGRARLSGLTVITDFQYGRLALLGLGAGRNDFNVYFPDGVVRGLPGEVLAGF